MQATVRALVAVLAIACCAAPLGAQEPTPPPRDQEIKPLRGNLYDVRDGREHTVFLATRDGIVVVDPLTRDAAMSLKQHLDVAFPGVPVRYVVLTHHHADRSLGAGVFEGAQVVAQRQYSEQLSRSRRTNDAEYRFVRDTRETFFDAYTLHIGDASVQLAHVHSTHAPEMAVVYFPNDRVLFAVAPPPVSGVPFTFDTVRPRDAFAWIDAVAAIDPELLVFDDGTMMEGEAFRQLVRYLNTVRRDVASAYELGRSMADTQAMPLSPPDAGAPHAVARNAHIAAVYASLRLLRIDLAGIVGGTYVSRNPSALCGDRFRVCTAGGGVGSATGAIAVTLGNRFGAITELTLNRQLWTGRARSGFEEETALRLSRGAVLFRYGAPRPGQLSAMPVAGLSRTVGDAAGVSHVPGVQIPVGGYHVIGGRDARLGVTAGIDLIKTTRRGFSIGAPIRITRMGGARPAQWPSMFDVQAGVGVSVPLVRRLIPR